MDRCAPSVVAIALTVAFAAGCGELAFYARQGCDRDRDCPFTGSCLRGLCVACPACGLEEVCVFGQCAPRGCADRPCPAGFGCFDGECRSSDCVEVDCPAGQRCALGACYPIDCVGAGCGADQICLSTGCASVACAEVTCPAGERCASGRCFPADCPSLECPDSALCADGRCTPQACAGVSCPDGTLCAEGRCRPTSCADRPCGEGLVCIDDRCVQPECEGVACAAGTRCERGACVACAGAELDCANGADEDCSGAADCADPACADAPCGPLPCERCAGGACAPAGPSLPCRSSAGDCDVEERCDGVQRACPADLFAPPATCRIAADACDAAEACPGDEAQCPQDDAQPDGTPCGGAGQVCWRGACASGCVIGGALVPLGSTNPANACERCEGARLDGWTALADGADCATGWCSAGACRAGCWIAGVSVAEGASEPASGGCRRCEAASSRTSWTALAPDSACAADAEVCTADVCDAAGACTHPALADGSPCGSNLICEAGTCRAGCRIGGVFYADLEPNPASPDCQRCDATLSTAAWTLRVEGAPCPADADACTADVCDASGACVHLAAADGTSCGTGLVCESGVCRAGCWIDGARVPDGQTNPLSGGCQTCDAAASPAAWSDRPAGTACAADANACTDDRCNASGACSHPAVAEGTACGPSQVCRNGACVSDSGVCVIGGQTYASGETGVEPCKVCDPASSTSSWTPVLNGPCPDDGVVCTDDFCSMGTCTHDPVPDAYRVVCGPGMICVGGRCGATGGCTIGGKFYPADAVNPASSCQYCDPATSQTVWTSLRDGVACPNGECCSGACLDTQIDVCNCGRCGNTCDGGPDPSPATCVNGRCNCFAAGTPILMADGRELPIEEVRAGDRVRAFDLERGAFTERAVVRTFEHAGTDGVWLLNGEVRATANHPFFAAGRWTAVADLRVGELLLAVEAHAGALREAPLQTLQFEPGARTTYNLEVEGEHDYFAAGYLVHNKTVLDGCIPIGPGPQ